MITFNGKKLYIGFSTGVLFRPFKKVAVTVFTFDYFIDESNAKKYIDFSNEIGDVQVYITRIINIGMPVNVNTLRNIAMGTLYRAINAFNVCLVLWNELECQLISFVSKQNERYILKDRS